MKIVYMDFVGCNEQEAVNKINNYFIGTESKVILSIETLPHDFNVGPVCVRVWCKHET